MIPALYVETQAFLCISMTLLNHRFCFVSPFSPGQSYTTDVENQSANDTDLGCTVDEGRYSNG